MRVQGSGFRDQGSEFRVQGSGIRVQGSGFRGLGSGVGVQGSGFRVVVRVQGSGFRVEGFRVQGLRCPAHHYSQRRCDAPRLSRVQGYLAHKKQPPPLGPR